MDMRSNTFKNKRMRISPLKIHPFNSPLKVSIILNAISICAYLISIIQATGNGLNFYPFGLFSTLPPSYFAATFLLSISFLILLYSNKNCTVLLFVQVLVLIIYLFLTPLLLEGTPRFNSSFIIGGEIDYLIRNGFLNPVVARYHNWPNVAILGTFISLTSNLDIETLLASTPFLSQVLYFIILIPLFTLLLGNGNEKWVAIWVFFVSNWLNQDYFSPQNIAFLLYMVFLTLIFKKSNIYNYKIKTKFLMILLFIAIVGYHVLTPFILILHVVAILLINKIYKLNNNIKFESLLVVFFIIYMTWQLFGAGMMFSTIIRSLSHAISLDTTYEATSNLINSGSVYHLFLTRFRVYYGILLYILSFLGAFYVLIVKHQRNYISYSMVLLAVFSIGLISVGKYGGEIVIRIILFSLIPISYFISKYTNANNKLLKTILILFLIISPILHIIAHYGNETIDYNAPDDIKGANFFFTHTYLNNSSIMCNADSLFLLKQIENYKHYKLDSPSDQNNLMVQRSYIWLTRRGEQVYIFQKNDYELYDALVIDLNNDYYHNKIYSSKHFQVYTE